uniref:C-type lectin domain-containing protein n=1 Tax=Xiphophorus couchianus TaxID=32473 RepID=A0A3B5L8N7_9TELE
LLIYLFIRFKIYFSFIHAHNLDFNWWTAAKKNDSSQKYFLIKELKTWLEAQSYCRDKHTDLISGTNGEVNKGLHLMTANSRYIFIGLFRDTWRWSDGNINSGQCAMTVFDDGGRWRNENCDKKKHFICYGGEINVEPRCHQRVT